jgi:hypothetical protein
MLKQKTRQYKEGKEGSLSDSVYGKAYNDFAILVEKSYSPRFVESTKSEALNIAEMGQEPSKHERESQEELGIAFTKYDSVVALDKVSRRRGKSKPSPKRSET